MLLLGYQYEVVYRKGKDNNADPLSRYTLETAQGTDLVDYVNPCANNQSHVVASVRKDPPGPTKNEAGCEPSETGNGFVMCDKNLQPHSHSAVTEKVFGISETENSLWHCIEKPLLHSYSAVTESMNNAFDLEWDSLGLCTELQQPYSCPAVTTLECQYDTDRNEVDRCRVPSKEQVVHKTDRTGFVEFTSSSRSVQTNNKEWLEVKIKYNDSPNIGSVESQNSDDKNSKPEEFIDLI